MIPALTPRLMGPRVPPSMSVVISTRDRGHYLQTCLESLATQDCPVAFEVVVVDNDSSDNTPQLVREFVERDDRFRYIIEEKVGLSHAKNAGVRASVSSLIVFTDDDVVLDRRWLHSFAKCAERQSNPLFILGGPIHPIPHDLGRWPSWLPNEALRDLPFLDHRATRPLKPFEYLWGANIAAPARVFDELGPWDVELGRSGDLRGTYEDVELVDRVRSSGGTAFFCSDARLHHRVERSTVSPGYVLRRAFSRGTTDHWRRRSRGASAGPQPAAHLRRRGTVVTCGSTVRLAGDDSALSDPSESSIVRASTLSCVALRLVSTVHNGG